MNKLKKIHFVCVGNTLRSRLAEAYLKSKDKNIEVSSSGIDAVKNENGPITIYAKNIAKDENIVKFLKKNWTQATKEIIENQDLVIFMQREYYNFCKDKLKCNVKKYYCWNIGDVTNLKKSKTLTQEQKYKIHTKETELIFKRIKHNIDTLIKKEAF